MQSFLVFIKDETIRVITNGVRLHLDSFLQSFLQHRQQVFLFHAQKTGVSLHAAVWPFNFRHITVRLEQCRAARTERAVGNNFDGAQIEPIAERFDDWAFAQKPLRLWSRSIHGFVNAQLQFSFAVKFFVEIYIAIAAAGILNLRQAEFDAALIGENDRLLDVRFRGFRNVTAHKRLRIVEQHAHGLTRLFVAQNLTAKGIFRVFRHAANLQRSAVRNRAMPIGPSKKHRIVR